MFKESKIDDLQFWRIICFDVFRYDRQDTRKSSGLQEGYDFDAQHLMDFLHSERYRQAIILDLLFQNCKDRSQVFDRNYNGLPLQRLGACRRKKSLPTNNSVLSC